MYARSGAGARLSLLKLTLATLFAALVLTGCGAANPAKTTSDGGPKRELILVAYSIPDKAYEKIIPAFRRYWKDRADEDIVITESYGGSGSQARAVIDGLEADVVHLGMEPDVEEISKAGLIDVGWQERTIGKGIPTTSLIVFGVRPGNPEGITGWSDVSREGVEVITPDPRISSGAQWNLLASWGSVIQSGGSPEQAFEQVERLYDNAVVLDRSARDASNTFLRKEMGDVALFWESDANIAQASGAQFDVVIPPETILAETAVAVVDSNARRRGNEDLAKAFVEFLFSREAQEIFAEEGLRPVNEDVLQRYASKFPMPAGDVFTIAEFGGWKRATPEFFGEAGFYSTIEANVAKRR